MSSSWLGLVVGLGVGMGCRAETKSDDDDLSDTVDIPDDGTTGGTTEPEVVDVDGDGHPADTDCDDENGAVYPGADETCNGRDDDCDGDVDEDAVDAFWTYGDADGDGYGGVEARSVCTVEDGWVRSDGDCDDTNPEVHPGATELCDAVDRDCDGMLHPEGRFADFIGLSGDVTHIAAEGTTEWAQPVLLDASGTLQVCEGAFPVQLEVSAESLEIVGWGADTSILDGRGGTVVALTTPGQVVSMLGITIQNGGNTGFEGAGITTREAWDVSLSLTDVAVTRNVGERIGAGIMLAGDLSATSVQIYDNTLSFDHADEPDLENYFNCEGAGAYVSGDVVLEDVAIFDNTVECVASNGVGAPRVWGGGLSVGSTLVAVDSQIQDNVAHVHIDSGYSGQAVAAGAYVYAGATLVGVEVSGNQASVTGTCRPDTSCHRTAGAGGLSIPGDSVLEDSLVVGNSVEVPGSDDTAIGGGVEAGVGDFVCRCTDPEAMDCGVYGNVAREGGGLWFVSGSGEEATLTSEGCDWTGSADNVPDDVGGWQSYPAGDDAWFYCDVDGCG